MLKAALAVAASAACALVAWPAGAGAEVGPAASGGPHRAARAGLSPLRALPVQVQGVISSTLGAGQPAYGARRAADGWRLGGGGVSAAAGARGVVLRSASGGEALTMAVAGLGRARRLDPVGASTVTARGDRVSYRYATIREWLAAGPLGIEQGFAVARRPAGAGGELTVAVGLGGGLRARLVDGRLGLVTRSGAPALRYGGLTAMDATGRRLPASMSLQHGSLRVRVADRGARYPVSIDPFIQQGAKLTGAGESGQGDFGYSVALSGNGTTALVGAWGDGTSADVLDTGAVWVFTKSGGAWSEQTELVGDCTSSCASQGTGESGAGAFGFSVALSNNGQTALIGAPYDSNNDGAAWVFTELGTAWSEQAEVVGDCTTGCANQGTGEGGQGQFGYSVSLSDPGTAALIGAPDDNGSSGAAWVLTESGGLWSQQAKLVGDCTVTCAGQGTGESGAGQFGFSAALSGPGTAALVGAPSDSSDAGAAWVFASSGGAWPQQAELMGTGESGAGEFGYGVALSDAGGKALIGAPYDSDQAGAAWVFTGSAGTWAQQAELVGDCTGGDCANEGSDETGQGVFGSRVALSGSGATALIGGYGDNGDAGAAWGFTYSGGAWTQDAAKLVGDCTASCADQGSGESGAGTFGVSVALSSDGETALVGAPFDNSDVGAAWMFANAAYPPTASIASPQTGAGYTQGAVVNASFSCRPGASGGVLKSGTAGCAGTVADGQPIDTSTPGPHTLKVTATDIDGQTDVVSSTYTVDAPTGGGGGAGGGGLGGGGAGGGAGGGTPGGSGGGGSTGGGGSNGGGTCHVTAGHPQTSGSTALVPLRCAGAGGPSARLKLTLTVTDRANKQRRPAAGTARSRRHRRSGKIVVTVGGVTVTIGAGRNSSVRVSLNGAGRRLLAKQHRLRTTLVITETTSAGKRAVLHRTVTFTAAGRNTRHARHRAHRA